MRPGDITGAVGRILASFPPRIATPDETMLEHVRSALGRGLRGPQHCRPHNRLISIAGGGPSLQETWQDLSEVIVTANAGLGFLLSRGVRPWACGLLDARPHIADLIEPHPDIFYFVASICHPRVFDKLKDCKVVLWHPSGCPGIADVLPPDAVRIAGGSTMGLRWLTLGLYMGFQRFAFHGMDSSYRGASTHAYPDYRDGRNGRTPGTIEIDGYRTDNNFLEQVKDWIALRETFRTCEFKLYGDGLLQHTTRKRDAVIANPPKRAADKPLNIICVNAGNYLGRGEDYVRKLKDGVERHYKGKHSFHVIEDGPHNWWAKLQLFQRGRFEGRCLYFDLDTVITGDIGDLADYDGPFAGLRDVWQPGQMGSGVMSWTAGEADHIWTNWVDAGKPTGIAGGDQAFITEQMPMAMRLQDIVPGQLVSWKAQCGMSADQIPADARVVFFHGQPRIHETELWHQ